MAVGGGGLGGGRRRDGVGAVRRRRDTNSAVDELRDGRELRAPVENAANRNAVSRSCEEPSCQRAFGDDEHSFDTMGRAKAPSVTVEQRIRSPLGQRPSAGERGAWAFWARGMLIFSISV